MRAQPPGGAATGERREVFNSALEQAEQLFKAGAEVGYASRPLLLFYGLSQAGRAIAAASTAVTGNGWRLSGHGIRVRNLMQHPSFLRDLVVEDFGSGSFTQLAPLVGSSTLPGGAPLGQFWQTIPDLPAIPLGPGAASYTPPLRVEFTGVSDGSRALGYLMAFGPPFPSLVTEQQTKDFIDQYPCLEGHTMWPEAGSIVEREDHIEIPRGWPYPANGDLRGLEHRLTEPYRGNDDRWAFPGFGGSALPLLPLLAWWALLYALSMLARYEPAGWTHHIDVDQSGEAVPLEVALTFALDACPELVVHAIHTVTR